jgi:Ca-activated chloride channel family protein
MKTGNYALKQFICAVAFAAALFGITALWLAPPLLAGAQKGQTKPTPAPTARKEIQIDLDKAVAVTLPQAGAGLRPVSFTTPDGKQGWAVHLPGNRPIATPAFADGLIFVGGGYGSHEFYALDAATGRVVWQMKTQDDGPTAAVVQDGYVAFNTESCTVIVAEARTGKIVWQEWLGDPLMSQPAISQGGQGRLYIAYPSNERKPQRTLNQRQAANREPGHYLLCADLKTGRHLWEQKITGDVISAPVVEGGQLFFTCFDGTSFCLDAVTGAVVWQKQDGGTSAPLIVGGQIVTTAKETKDGKAYEGLKRLDARQGRARDRELLAKEKADYLSEDKGGGVAISATQAITLDSSVGFSSAPSAAKLGDANKHIGVSSVAGAWAYQGSRAAYGNGQVMNAQGRYLNSIRAGDGAFAWRAELRGGEVSEGMQVFSPPALGASNLYLCGALGHLAAVQQQDGAVVFLYAFKKAMAFQPALARGNVYAGTTDGWVICLKTGNADADGWYAWGGNAQHNKHQ